MIKKYISLCLIIVLVVFVTGCSEKEKDQTAGNSYDAIEAYETYFTFEDVVKNSDCAIVGEYIETLTHENYIEQKFLVKEVLYGSVSEDEIYLYSNIGTGHIIEIDYSYTLGTDKYEKNTDYILIMETYESVMYDHTRYMVTTDILLCESTNEYTMYSTPISWPDDITFREYIMSIDVPNNQDSMHTEYSNDIEALWGESEFVGLIEIVELKSEGKVHTGNTYRITVNELFKGENLNTYDDGTILLVILKNTVEVGNTYLAGFTPVNENSLIYNQATDTSVIIPTDENLAEIKSYQN